VSRLAECRAHSVGPYTTFFVGNCASIHLLLASKTTIPLGDIIMTLDHVFAFRVHLSAEPFT